VARTRPRIKARAKIVIFFVNAMGILPYEVIRLVFLW
jgi:hypothetical protein